MASRDRSPGFLRSVERDQRALLARVEALYGVLLAIEVDLENDDVCELRPLGERVENLVLGLASRTPRGGDVDEDRSIAALRGFEGSGIEFSLFQRRGRSCTGNRKKQCKEESRGDRCKAHLVLHLGNATLHDLGCKLSIGGCPSAQHCDPS
jgi:hypothetical protein